MNDKLRSIEWGLVVLDEVHCAPAKSFRQILFDYQYHCALGLTATLLREDNRIDDLNFLIGPKLYEANWLDLRKSNFIADLRCAEIRCPMSPSFYEQYWRLENGRIASTLAIMNPFKIRYCYYLIKFHEERGDQVIVFFDDLISIEKYAEILKCQVIVGATKEQDRMRLLSAFRQKTIRVICVSSVGDTSIDLPDASVGIQVSSIFGGRRKETQRIGRVLRPKSECSVSYFYSLVSSDTREVRNSAKRQQFLANQGFSYKIIPSIKDIEAQTSDLVLDEHDILRKTIILASQRLSFGDSLSSRSLSGDRTASIEDNGDDDESDDEEEEDRMFLASQSRMLSSNISGGSTLEYFERSSQA